MLFGKDLRMDTGRPQGREMKEPVVSARACVCNLEQQVKFSHREELRDLLL